MREASGCFEHIGRKTTRYQQRPLPARPDSGDGHWAETALSEPQVSETVDTTTKTPGRPPRTKTKARVKQT
jgi:hypothetical protein